MFSSPAEKVIAENKTLKGHRLRFSSELVGIISLGVIPVLPLAKH